jgi:urocanate hydratase
MYRISSIHCRDIFSLGFGPFRWVCTSGLEEDLRATDQIASDVLKKIIQGETDNDLFTV